MKTFFLLAVGFIAINAGVGSVAVAADSNASETKLSTPLSRTSDTSVRKMALEETAIIPTESKEKSSEAAGTNSAMLSLKDPHQDVNLRSWKYFLTLSAQSFSPKGTTANDLGTQFNLNEQSATVMPAVGLGASGAIVQREEMTVGWGLGAKIAYSSQNAVVTRPNGFRIDDARLNTTQMNLNPYLSFTLAQLSNVDLRVGYLLGSINYTETSSNDFAKFSRQAAYQGANIGVDYRLSRRWSVLADYSYKTLSRSTDIEIPESSLEVGTRVIW